MAGHLAAQEAVWAGPPPPPRCASFSCPLSRASGGSWVERGGCLSLPRLLGLIWAPWSVLGLHLAPGSSIDRTMQVSGVW